MPDTEIGAWHLSKRNVAMERFADLIEEMYRES